MPREEQQARTRRINLVREGLGETRRILTRLDEAVRLAKGGYLMAYMPFFEKIEEEQRWIELVIRELEHQEPNNHFARAGGVSSAPVRVWNDWIRRRETELTTLRLEATELIDQYGPESEIWARTR